MSLFYRTLLPSMAAVILLAGCAGSPKETDQGAPLARQLTASDHCGLTRPGLVYLDSLKAQQAYSSLNGQMFSFAAADNLDFSREHLLVVALGNKPTGGYGLTLESASYQDESLVITAKLRQPPAGAAVTQVLTTPCVVLAIAAEGWGNIKVQGHGLTTMTRAR
ncbi:protease complex subunit PrcB family protein [Marinobacter caseinilyticus]|uniref:protease complex subunit PrcB family protein n=1 Tax=Marinobacter caseinilyticus TaxID=2692195 RepID=UPI00140872D2|nr:protease complex subunit PrcB family protein [Marinobacter caseinilyticus]